MSNVVLVRSVVSFQGNTPFRSTSFRFGN